MSQPGREPDAGYDSRECTTEIPDREMIARIAVSNNLKRQTQPYKPRSVD
ncbi:MAG: hypothetical protein ACT4QA_00635 [Panacagrimonas sp.]